MRLRLGHAALAWGITACSTAPRRVTAQDRGAIALGEVVDGLGVTPRVLMIAAHPDDEDTRLIAWLARGQHVETAYLSLTRGDGGQNLIGNELGEALGVIRTEELLAARRIDGAHQYFTRAYDFGFSKSADETYTHWPHDSILGDVVTVIRAFRPHIVVAVFTGTPRDGHGHHQVSGLIAREAYDAAGDTVRFPTAKYGPAWTVSKFYRDRSYFGAGAEALTIQVGDYNPLLGESYSEIASRSRSQHRSQGFGQLIRKGPFTASVYREASRVNSGPEKSMFDGLDNTTLAPYRALIDSIRQRWNPDDPTPLVPSLVHLVTRLQHAPGAKDADAERTLALAVGRAERALELASGLAIEATIPKDLVAAGDTTRVSVAIYDRGGWPIMVGTQNVAAGTVARDSFVVKGDTIAQPWWLVKPRVGDLFGVPVSRVAEDQLHQETANTHIVFGTEDDPVDVMVQTPIVERIADPSKGEIDRPMAVVPGVSVTFDQTVEYVPAKTTIDRPVDITLRSGWPGAHDVTLSLQLPRGLRADSAARKISLPGYGTRRVEFHIAGSLASGTTTLSATALADGQDFKNGYVPIEYEHIRPEKIYRDAVVHLVAVDVKVPAGLTVGYIPGVGDNVAPTLETLGIPVTMLDPNALGGVDLKRFGAVVVGTRAYQANAELRATNKKLLDYVRSGGTLVVQYGQYEMTEGLMPYPITLSRPADRVTDENAPVRILDPASPVLNTPNKIGPADWVGWVQERSSYMPHTFDSHYHAVVSMNDPGEEPNNAGILVTPLGKGTYVYTTLSFFRQLPAGNPGAARLFVNLLAAGRTPIVQ
jgi:LmbE family N-acetylglucosaminyl deacetylase